MDKLLELTRNRTSVGSENDDFRIRQKETFSKQVLFPFYRYGPVQSVRSLSGRGDVGTAVTVAFMDIKSACKARQTENKLDER